MVRQLYRLANQAIGFNPATALLIVAQRWTGFADGREAFVLAVNDLVTGQRAGPPVQVAREFAAAAAQLTRWVVTEEQARGHLERMGRPRQRLCPDSGCGAKLPLGGMYCLVCGLNGTVPIAAQPARPDLTIV